MRVRRASNESAASRCLPLRRVGARRGARPSRARLSERSKDNRVDSVHAVDTCLEIRRAGPLRECANEVAVEAEAREALDELRSQRLIDVDPVFLGRDSVELAMEGEESPELNDRPFVVVDTKVYRGVGEMGIAAAPLDDEQCGGLLAPAVAPCRLRGGEALDESFRQLQVPIPLERRRERLDRCLGA